MTLSAAIVAAVRLHEGQVDKAGAPYILHPLRVMLAMRTDEERILAVLHDTAEDAGWERVLAELGDLPPWLEKGLEALTRRRGESYEAFIERLAGNTLARHVKLADLADNLDRSRIWNPTPEDLARFDKYERARRELQKVDEASRFGWDEGDFESGGVRFEQIPRTGVRWGRWGGRPFRLGTGGRLTPRRPWRDRPRRGGSAAGRPGAPRSAAKPGGRRG